MTVPIRIEFLPDADRTVPLPSYQTSGAAGADVRANLPDGGSVTVLPMGRALIPTGFRMEIPHGYEVQVRPRSGLALKHGITLPNTPGTIDSDYRGPVGVILLNTGNEPYVIQHGDRIAQFVVAPVVIGDFQIAEALDDTERGTGGFGSTGTT